MVARANDAERFSDGAWRPGASCRPSKPGSGLSVQAFCRREGINAWTFYGWRSRLRAGIRESKITIVP
jgi:transposase-like protein